MLAEDHRKAAEDIEVVLAPLHPIPRADRVIIESAWGAAFHWIAYSCETKHHQHQESHAKLVSFLRSLGEIAAADWWATLERFRQGGWYGKNTDPAAAQKALAVLDQIRTWAST